VRNEFKVPPQVKDKPAAKLRKAICKDKTTTQKKRKLEQSQSEDENENS
jgi:hypothetical protein